MAKKNGKAKRGNSKDRLPREPVRLHSFTIRPPEWKTQEKALDYLDGEFRDLLWALHDLCATGIEFPDVMLFDMGSIAEALAEFLREPRPVRIQDDALVFASELTSALTSLEEKKRNEGWWIKTRDGVLHDLPSETLPVLAKVAAHACASLGEVAGAEWETEQKNRAKVSDLSWEQYRLGKEIRRLEPERDEGAGAVDAG